jgi:soluble lytic murein transglycosylase
MAWLGGKYGSASHSVFYTQQLLKELGIRENIFLMSDQLVRMILPMPFRDCVSRYSAQYGIDSNSVYSLIKAESLFNSRIRSSAGAVGLMQLMPGTAGDIAKKTGTGPFDLENPCTSIHFGIHYLSWLKGYLNGNFVYMVAAYNAGAGNVNKWKKKLPENDMDYFTEFVPFRETRYYILRTGKFIRQYAIISGS